MSEIVDFLGSLGSLSDLVPSSLPSVPDVSPPSIPDWTTFSLPSIPTAPIYPTTIPTPGVTYKVAAAATPATGKKSATAPGPNSPSIQGAGATKPKFEKFLTHALQDDKLKGPLKDLKEAKEKLKAIHKESETGQMTAAQKEQQKEKFDKAAAEVKKADEELKKAANGIAQGYKASDPIFKNAGTLEFAEVLADCAQQQKEGQSAKDCAKEYVNKGTLLDKKLLVSGLKDKALEKPLKELNEAKKELEKESAKLTDGTMKGKELEEQEEKVKNAIKKVQEKEEGLKKAAEEIAKARKNSDPKLQDIGTLELAEILADCAQKRKEGQTPEECAEEYVNERRTVLDKKLTETGFKLNSNMSLYEKDGHTTARFSKDANKGDFQKGFAAIEQKDPNNPIFNVSSGKPPSDKTRDEMVAGLAQHMENNKDIEEVTATIDGAKIKISKKDDGYHLKDENGKPLKDKDGKEIVAKDVEELQQQINGACKAKAEAEAKAKAEAKKEAEAKAKAEAEAKAKKEADAKANPDAAKKDDKGPKAATPIDDAAPKDDDVVADEDVEPKVDEAPDPDAATPATPPAAPATPAPDAAAPDEVPLPPSPDAATPEEIPLPPSTDPDAAAPDPKTPTPAPDAIAPAPDPDKPVPYGPDPDKTLAAAPPPTAPPGSKHPPPETEAAKAAAQNDPKLADKVPKLAATAPAMGHKSEEEKKKKGPSMGP